MSGLRDAGASGLAPTLERGSQRPVSDAPALGHQVGGDEDLAKAAHTLQLYLELARGTA
ncbi:hypothetical protein [uncultured Thiodictyon sp.]|uniref:hypothetical protein n=1 Tax=uncultured Thiodictyon sp. TaxID=1846217 RepID=UPI0025D8388B|nr:hypothetical protein [uncultured Thiodictyon sp.]